METCSKCGKRGEPIIKGARIMAGTVDAFKGRIMRCPICSNLFCGACGEVPNSSGDVVYKCPNCSVSLQPL